MYLKTTKNLAFALSFFWRVLGVAPTTGAPPVYAISAVGPVAGSSLTQGQTVKPVGTIKSIGGSTITLAPDAGAEINVQVPESAQVLQISPGQKDLKSATPIHFQDLQVGDRILIFGKASGDGKSVEASIVVVMKSSDVEAKQQQERQEWQHGVGGLVDVLDVAAGTVNVSTAAPGGSKKISVQAGKKTIIRRYAPDSVKFSDAKPSTLDQIKPGDQLRARGKNAESGVEFTAVEIVFGSFRNIAGTIVSVDVPGGTIRVTDLATKRPVLVKISGDSQLRLLPPAMAQFLAMRLKSAGGKAAANPTAGSPAASAATAAAPGARSVGDAGPSSGSGSGPASGRGSRQNGPPDLQQILTHMPSAAIADFHKGDAVMIVSTEGSVPGEVTAITILGGVEPLLSASPTGGQAMMTLSPWNLGSSSTGSGAAEGEAGAP
jgi:co-chaperonin GroES (HSP10)